MTADRQVPALDAVLLGIDAAIAELVDLQAQLGELLHESSRRPELSTGRRPPSSRPPWEAQAAGAHLDVHGAARAIEAQLRGYVFGDDARRPGGSDAATREALRMVSRLVRHERVPEHTVRDVARTLGRLVRACQSVPAIDTAPAPPATLRFACPACGTGALQAAVDGSTAITCSNGECIDATTGARTSWPRHRWHHLLGQVLAQ